MTRRTRSYLLAISVHINVGLCSNEKGISDFHSLPLFLDIFSGQTLLDPLFCGEGAFLPQKCPQQACAQSARNRLVWARDGVFAYGRVCRFEFNGTEFIFAERLRDGEDGSSSCNGGMEPCHILWSSLYDFVTTNNNSLSNWTCSHFRVVSTSTEKVRRIVDGLSRSSCSRRGDNVGKGCSEDSLS